MKNFKLNVKDPYTIVETQDSPFISLFGSFTGVRHVIKLNDKYQVSAIKKYGSYGYEEDLWEIALLNDDTLVPIEERFPEELCDDVIGFLTEDEVNSWLDKFYNKFCVEE